MRAPWEALTAYNAGLALEPVKAVFGGLATLLGGGPKPNTPAAPAPPPPPAVAPTPDDAAIQDAQKRELLAASQRSGRASTILGDSNDSASDKLGG